MTITFALRDQAAFWLLDNVSMLDVNTNSELLLNGDFEQGNGTHWDHCQPLPTSNPCSIGQNGSFAPQSGQHFYFGAPHPNADYLSQVIRTDIGGNYTLSFWVGHTGNSSSNAFLVTLTS